jgi:hypothetical protein
LAVGEGEVAGGVSDGLLDCSAGGWALPAAVGAELASDGLTGCPACGPADADLAVGDGEVAGGVSDGLLDCSAGAWGLPAAVGAELASDGLTGCPACSPADADLAVGDGEVAGGVSDGLLDCSAGAWALPAGDGGAAEPASDDLAGCSVDADLAAGEGRVAGGVSDGFLGCSVDEPVDGAWADSDGLDCSLGGWALLAGDVRVAALGSDDLGGCSFGGFAGAGELVAPSPDGLDGGSAGAGLPAEDGEVAGRDSGDFPGCPVDGCAGVAAPASGGLGGCSVDGFADGV